MSAIATNDDYRSNKTEKALFEAMLSLMKKNTFKKITIKSICEEAFISRAAFYAHFIDKYDLLAHWLIEIWPKEPIDLDDYAYIETFVNSQIQEHMLVLRNLLYDLDKEAYSIIYNFLLSTINLTVEKNRVGDYHPKDVVLSNFYAAGIISYLIWQTEHKFPSGVPPMNKYFFEMIHELQNWKSK